MRAVAPLIVWLHNNHVRYIMSDWITEWNNGEKSFQINQKGQIIGKQNITSHFQCLCSDGFKGICLAIDKKFSSKAHINIHALTHQSFAEHFINSVYCIQYQQRTYLYDK